MSRSLGVKLGITLFAVGGIILWNTWVLGFLNHGIDGYTQMSISELNVNGQPFYRFFTDTEWLSGLSLLVGGLLLMYAVRKSGYFLIIALALTTLIGGLTIFDTTHPLDCNRYQNQACQLKWARGEVSSDQKAHDIESETTDYVTILLSIELLVWAFRNWLSKNERSYMELGFVTVLAVTIIGPIFISSNDIVVEAVGQRIWNTLTSVLFLYIMYRIQRTDPTIGPTHVYSQRKTRKAIA